MKVKIFKGIITKILKYNKTIKTQIQESKITLSRINIK